MTPALGGKRLQRRIQFSWQRCPYPRWAGASGHRTADGQSTGAAASPTERSAQPDTTDSDAKTERQEQAVCAARPEVECIARGKARTPYEFSVKVSIVTTHKEGLVAGARSMPGNPYDGHTLYETLEQAEILSSVKPQMAFVDRGYRGVEIDGVQIWKSGQRRGVTRGLKAMIKRRSAIEPTIGHMKSDGELGRNWLKGALGDAMHAVLCGAGHNLRLIMRKLRLFCADILAMLLRVFRMPALPG
jgi:IS5 family transposase